jgi:hypothetical protein
MATQLDASAARARIGQASDKPTDFRTAAHVVLARFEEKHIMR